MLGLLGVDDEAGIDEVDVDDVVVDDVVVVEVGVDVLLD